MGSSDGGIRHYLDTKDSKGTGTLKKHLVEKHSALWDSIQLGQSVPNAKALKNPTLEAAF